LPRIPKKSTKILAKARAEGEVLGKLQAEEHFKGTQKGWMKSIRDHIGKIIDRIDPLEVGATVGLTVIIHELIMKTPELYKQAIGATEAFAALATWFPRTVIPAVGQIFNITMDATTQEANKQAMEYQKLLTQSEMWIWLVSFALAYILVKHGGQIFGLLKKA
jgi:hypothetical protein